MKLRILRQRKALLWSGLYAGLTCFYGCSAGTPPTETVAKAELDVRAASEAKAEDFARIIREAVDRVRGGGDAPPTKAEWESRQPLNTKPADE